MAIFILVHDRFFRIYVRDGLEYVIDCYAGEALCHSYTDLLELPSEVYER